MIPSPSLNPSGDATAICFALVLLIPFAAAGLALINTGLGRTRSAAHMMMASLCVFSAAALAYFICGFSWQGFAGGYAHILMLGGKEWNWIGAGPFFLRGMDPGNASVTLAATFGMLSTGVAVLIPLGSGADRWRLGAACASAALMAGLTFPLFAHWAWSGGWLAQLGANYGLGRGFVDVGGAGAIQAVGGLTALSIAWILGPRRGKFASDGMPSAIPGHNSVYVLLGCLLTLLGWWGLNGAGAILFGGVEAGRVAYIAINTLLSAAASAGAAAVLTRARYGRPDASLTANGWVGGLAASSAACAFVVPAASVVIGILAGALVTFSVEWFEARMRVDDPGGAISAHGLGGMWGLLSVALFARIPVNEGGASSGAGQWLAQVIGIATLLGFVLPLTYGLNWLLNRVMPQRVAPEGERQGMDLYELGAGAYPELATHADEFTQHRT